MEIEKAVKCPECGSVVTSTDGYCPVCDAALERRPRPLNWRPIILAALFLAGVLAVWLGFSYVRHKAERFYHERILEPAVGEEDKELFGD